MKYTHIFWDFNGTLYDDVEACITAVNEMLAERKLDVIENCEHYREVFDFPVIEYYRGLGFDFEAEPYYEVLAPAWVALYNKYSVTSPLTEDARQVLDEVRGQGIKQVLFSATEINMLRGQLNSLGISDAFDEIIGLDNIHAGGKLHLARMWKEAHPEARVLYVGDTVHDAENAACLGADCLLYAGGHQSQKRLSVCGCPIIDGLREVLNYI